MKTFGTYLQNDARRPIAYGEINLINPPRQRLRGEEAKPGIRAETVFAGFCGTDYELMKMGRAGKLEAKFPPGQTRLINGHEGVVWVPEQRRFAVVLIRGGDSWDPTRFTEDESYFEYGCDGADGLFSDHNYYNPDMLLCLPERYMGLGRLPLSLAKKLVFCDPYACAVFQLERMEEIGEAQNLRVEMAKRRCAANDARNHSRKSTFDRVVIYGLGTTGLFIGDQIRRNYPEADILFVGRSTRNSVKVRFALRETGAQYLCTEGLDEAQAAGAIKERLGGTATVFVGASGTQTEHRVAFEHGALGCNGIYNSFSLGPKIAFDTMPFGFKNHVILSAINFRQAHMERAINILCESRYDELVSLLDKECFIADPLRAYENDIYCKGAPLKTAMVWNAAYMDMEG